MTARPTLPDERSTEPRATPFGSLVIAYDERVLAPREWTTAQSAWAAELLHELPGGPVLELCCGAGHIGLLAVQGSRRDLVQVDRNPVACAFARTNAERARPRGRVEVREGPMDEVVAADERFALVIADPPYLPAAAVGTFPEDPVLAVDGGTDGLDLVWLCLEMIRRHLAPAGQALLQLRDTMQSDALRDRLAADDGALRLVEVRAVGDHGVVARLTRADPEGPPETPGSSM